MVLGPKGCQVVLHLRLPALVDAPGASASVSSRKMRVAVKVRPIALETWPRREAAKISGEERR